ncbi:MAG: hypothetical protein IJN78_01065 [Clostridia bacterium]|nr:hypothetical protein [Clostridia bacterium]
MNTNFKELAAWDKFAQSGKICDYLQYKHISRETANEAEHGRIDNTGATDGRG